MVAINENRFGARDAQSMSSFFGDAKSVMEGLFGKSTTNDLPPLAQAAIEQTARIRAIAARKFGDADGEELLEALADAVMRRPFTLPPHAFSGEQRLAYADQREGQAQVFYMLLSWIAEGRSEQPPQREGTTHAKSNRVWKRSIDVKRERVAKRAARNSKPRGG